MLTPEQERQVRHLVAHAARILLFTTARPDLGNLAEYQAQMDLYRLRWATVPREDRARVPAELIVHPELGDLTAQAVGTAVASLRGWGTDQVLGAIAPAVAELQALPRSSVVDERGQLTTAAKVVAAQLAQALDALEA